MHLDTNTHTHTQIRRLGFTLFFENKEDEKAAENEKIRFDES